MIRRFASLLAAMVLAAGTTLSLGSTPAMAAWNDCPVGQVCWWQNANGQGAWGHRTPAQIFPSCWSMGAFGNSASSWRIRLSGTSWDVRFDTAGTCSSSGSANVITIGGGDNQSNFVGAYNDWLGGISVY